MTKDLDFSHILFRVKMLQSCARAAIPVRGVAEGMLMFGSLHYTIYTFSIVIMYFLSKLDKSSRQSHTRRGAHDEWFQFSTMKYWLFDRFACEGDTDLSCKIFRIGTCSLDVTKVNFSLIDLTTIEPVCGIAE